jgi:hypothetical protein
LSKKNLTEKKFYKLPTYKLPLIARHLFVPCTFDLIINISKGLSQGFERCTDTKQLTFLVDWELEKNFRQSFFQKFFFSYFKSFATKSLNKADVLWVANENMKGEFPNAEVVAPPFKMSDYALFPKSMFPHNFYLIDTTDLNFDFAQKIVDKFEGENIAFQFMGRDAHLKSLIFNKPNNHFFGERCSGEHAPVLGACKGFISFNRSVFPKMTLATLSTGRPVILHPYQKQWVSGSGTYFINDLSLESLTAAMKNLESEQENLEGDKLRAQVNRFHETKFKNKLQAFINSRL